MATDPEQTGDEVAQTLPTPKPASDKEKEKENNGAQKPERLFDAERDLDLTSLDAPSIADQAEQAIVKALADLNPAGIVFLAARHGHWEPHEMPQPGSAFHKYYKSLNYFATYQQPERGCSISLFPSYILDFELLNSLLPNSHQPRSCPASPSLSENSPTITPMTSSHYLILQDPFLTKSSLQWLKRRGRSATSASMGTPRQAQR
ncbi:hypothetical protein B0T24DRAFT_145157 [Lasiosphaeria ovina]|uniref:Uncharacterized protein n=1 Tax=Lasiosphaeria ovina TaxID=92902 RepID=A0AAE0KLW5_9PEZI|nr:hypothetical protein B0T24DRAFT_145157 [Lasiosphaeria ovina]